MNSIGLTQNALRGVKSLLKMLMYWRVHSAFSSTFALRSIVLRKPLTKTILILGALTVLHGCGDSDVAEVKQFIKEVKSEPTRRIEPLPQVKQYASVVYSASSLPSPFTKPDLRSTLSDGDSSELAPNKDRPPEPLESFPMDSLKMVGTMMVNDKNSAVVLDPYGVVHRVVVGNYVGNNFGKITAISASDIEVNEIVPEINGGWRLRKSTIVLGE